MTARVPVTPNIFGSRDEFHAELDPVDLRPEGDAWNDEATLARLGASAFALVPSRVRFHDDRSFIL